MYQIRYGEKEFRSGRQFINFLIDEEGIAPKIAHQMARDIINKNSKTEIVQAIANKPPQKEEQPLEGKKLEKLFEYVWISPDEINVYYCAAFSLNIPGLKRRCIKVAIKTDNCHNNKATANSFLHDGDKWNDLAFLSWAFLKFNTGSKTPTVDLFKEDCESLMRMSCAILGVNY